MRIFRIGATAACVLGASGMLSAQATRDNTTAVPSPTAWGLNGYSLVLVVGDMQPGGTAASVPSAARKALADVQSFLPYKRYQLLDAEWMLCCTSFGQVSGRVHGPDSHDYQYIISTGPADNARFNLHFSMRDVSATPGGRGGTRASELSDTARAEYSRQLYEATKERDDAEQAYTHVKKQTEVGVMTPADLSAVQIRLQRASDRVRELQAELSQGQARGGGGGGASVSTSIMDNTFFISLGETVVIGTSRLKGDQALIALLTAVPKSGRKD